MLAEDQTGKSGHRGKTGDEHRLAGAFGEDARIPLFRVPVQDVDAVGHANADDQRERHDVRRIKRDVKEAHQPAQPEESDPHRQEGQNH